MVKPAEVAFAVFTAPLADVAEIENAVLQFTVAVADILPVAEKFAAGKLLANARAQLETIVPVAGMLTESA